MKTKMSVTEIKQMEKIELEPHDFKPEEDKEEMLGIPKFLQEDKEVKITNAQKGTLVHLCMQKLNLDKKVYNYDDVKQLVTDLELKNIITTKEAESINFHLFILKYKH